MSIVALHGFTGCGADFAPFARLCGGDWHCPDLPGHLANAELDCSPESTIQFVQKQRDQIGPLIRPINEQAETPKKILLGYSMGARAALLHATQCPEAWDALILISVNPGIEGEGERALRRESDSKLAARIEQEGVASFLEFWQQTPLIRSQQNIPADWLNAMQANRQQHKAEGLANSLRQFGQGSFPNLWPSLPKLKMPTCLISGALDTKYTQIAKRILPILFSPQSIHTEVKSASHMPHLEQAKETALAIRSFLQQV